VMMGCPKFDDVEGYVAKFTEIFATVPLRSITVAIMEVPCCAQMRHIVLEALKNAKRDIPVDEVVVSTRGGVVRQGRMAA